MGFLAPAATLHRRPPDFLYLFCRSVGWKAAAHVRQRILSSNSIWLCFTHPGGCLLLFVPLLYSTIRKNEYFRRPTHTDNDPIDNQLIPPFLPLQCHTTTPACSLALAQRTTLLQAPRPPASQMTCTTTSRACFWSRTRKDRKKKSKARQRRRLRLLVEVLFFSVVQYDSPCPPGLRLPLLPSNCDSVAVAVAVAVTDDDDNNVVLVLPYESISRR
jgi:hypothetical protein